MRTPYAAAVALTVAALAFVAASPRAIGAPDASAADAAPPVPPCVHVSSQARYVPVGYNHYVTLSNACAKDASCSVSTDVNPTPVTVEVAAGKSVEVLTFMGSPASAFTARVACTLH